MEIPDLILSRLVYGASFRKLMGIEYGRAEEYLFRKKKKKQILQKFARENIYLAFKSGGIYSKICGAIVGLCFL